MLYVHALNELLLCMHTRRGLPTASPAQSRLSPTRSTSAQARLGLQGWESPVLLGSFYPASSAADRTHKHTST